MVAKQVSLSSLTTVKFNGIDITKIVWNNEVMWERKVVQETRKVWVTSGYYQSGTGVVDSGGVCSITMGTVQSGTLPTGVSVTTKTYGSFLSSLSPAITTNATYATLTSGDTTFKNVTVGPSAKAINASFPPTPYSISWASWEKKGTTQVWVDTSHEETVTEDITQYAYMNK